MNEAALNDAARQMGERLAQQIAVPFARVFADAMLQRLKEAGALAGEAPGMLSVAAVAARIGRTPKAVRHLIGRKELPVHKLGRRVMVDRMELERWIRANTPE